MAVNQITNLVRTKYQDEFRMDYERNSSYLKNCVRTDGAMRANTVTWDIVGTTDAAAARTRDGKIPVSQLPLSQVTADMQQAYKKYQIDDFDLFTTNPETRNAQAIKSRSAVNRAVDQLIFDTLDTATTTVAGGAQDASARGTYLNWVSQLWDNDVQYGVDMVYGVISPRTAMQMMEIDEFTNSDYVDLKAYTGNPTAPVVRKWLGVCWIPHSGVAGRGTATATNYLFAESAIGHQLSSDEPETHIYYEEEEDRYGTWAKIYHAAAVCLDNGIVKLTTDDTAAFS